MNTPTSITDLIAAEAALEAAGISTSAVEACGQAGCGWCDTAALPAAA
jgi:hypothetical protein